MRTRRLRSAVALAAVVSAAATASACSGAGDGSVPPIDTGEATPASAGTGGGGGYIPQPVTYNGAFTATNAVGNFIRTDVFFHETIVTGTTQSWMLGTSIVLPIANVLYDVNIGDQNVNSLWTHVVWNPASWVSASVLSQVGSYSTVYVDGTYAGFANYGGGVVYADLKLPRGTWTTLTLYVTIGNYTYAASPVQVLELPVSPFVLLQPTFRSPACSKCHSLGDNASISNFHVSRGAWAAPNPGAQPDTSAVCDSCHAPFIGGSGNWFSPSFGRNMNWSGMTLKQVCEAVVVNSQGFANFDDHIIFDPRLNWSFLGGPGGGGKLPGGLHEPAPPPYWASSMDDLAQLMDTDWTKDPATICAGLEWVPN